MRLAELVTVFNSECLKKALCVGVVVILVIRFIFAFF